MLTSVEIGEIQLKGNQGEIKSRKVEEIKLTTKFTVKRDFAEGSTKNITGV